MTPIDHYLYKILYMIDHNLPGSGGTDVCSTSCTVGGDGASGMCLCGDVSTNIT